MKKPIKAILAGILLVITSCSITGLSPFQPNQIPKEFTKSTEVYFCPQDNCSAVVEEKILNSNQSIHCTLYDLNLEELISALEIKSKSIDVKLVVDDHNFEDVEHLSFAKKDTSSQLSHNKFCIFDNQVVTTGSFNPTFNGNYRNNNNLLVFYSKYLAENYEDEFKELWNGKFGKGEQVKYPVIILNNNTIENYFCPEDGCADRIIEKVSPAEESIYFMTFSFTHDGIGDAIIAKSKSIEVKGIFEKTQNNKWNEYQKMEDAGLNVIWDKNKYKMHHKVFIIDKKIVITGSMNPSKNGDTNNDENILIIYDEGIAMKYLKEFERLFR